jgi:hypothetical protein
MTEDRRRTVRRGTARSKVRSFDRANAEAAAIIASDPERYGPAPVMWAEAWRARHEREHEFLARHHNAA